MSEQGPGSAGRVRRGDATALERRLLDAARRDRPSPELSARMAGAIGSSLPHPAPPGNLAEGSGSAPQAAVATSSLVPWLSGALVAAVVAGAFMTGRGDTVTPAPNTQKSAAALPMPAPSAVSPAAPEVEALAGERAQESDEANPGTPRALASPRAPGQAPAAELAAQIALVDSARSALASGRADRAFSIAGDYQMAYPSGTFRPEVSAIKIEALVKLGRKKEARALAERFVKTHGPGPLAERVARLGGLPQP